MAVKKGGLGRGLDALFDENANESGAPVTLRLSEIEPNKNQPRKDFDEAAIDELAASIEKHGLIQPIVVCPTASGVYRIVAGERRWRACRKAGLDTVPVIIKEFSERELSEVALIENLQREDLNPVEEAFGYKSLIDAYALTQEQVSESVGKSRSAVTNALRLLQLEKKYLDALREGKITAGHARALLSAEGAVREEMFRAALAGASVRELEKASKQQPAKAKEKAPQKKNTFYTEVELSLAEQLGRKVNIKPTKDGKGTITLDFYSDEELAEIAEKLAK